MKASDRSDEHRLEWDAQEHAVRDERRGVPSRDTREKQYRLIARVLRQPRIDPMPSNFAYQLAARIELLAQATDERFELWLQRVLVAVLVLAGSFSVAMLGANTRGALLVPIERPLTFGLQAIDGWGVIAIACIGVSWAIGRWRSAIKGS